MADQQDLKIRISTPADTTGADATAVSIDKVREATTGATRANREATKATIASTTATEANSVAEAFNASVKEHAAARQKQITAARKEAAAMEIKLPDYLKKTSAATKDQADKNLSAAETFEKLNGAANLSVGGMANAGKALKSLGAAFASNPITAAISLFLLLRPAAAAAGEALGDMLANANSLSDAILAGENPRANLTQQLGDIKKSGDQALEKIAKDAKTAADELTRLNEQVAEAEGRYNALASAALKAKLAELDLAEARALASATNETDRASIRSEFSGRRSEARIQNEAAGIDRTERFQRDRITEAERIAENGRNRIGAAEQDVTSIQRAIDAALARGRTQSASSPEGKQTLDSLRLFRAELDAAQKTLAKVREEEGKNIAAATNTRREAVTALKVNAANREALASSSQADSINSEVADTKAIDAAKKADEAKRNADAEQAFNLFNARAAAPGLQDQAQNVGRSNAGRNDRELFTAAKALNDAAAAATEGGTTGDEAKGLVEAGKNLQAAFKARDIRSAALESAVADLVQITADLRSNTSNLRTP